MSIFGTYSHYYDLLYCDKDYDKEVEYLDFLIKKYAPCSKSLLELGCGTGKHAALLKKKGYDIFGIDNSVEMLNLARAQDVDCTLGDVRTVRVNKVFDAVLSLFHIASYQNTDADIVEYFKTISLHVKEGGIFIFDIWYFPAVRTQLPEERTKKMENDLISVSRHCLPNHLMEKHIVEVNYTISITDKSIGSIETIQEKHCMRYFSCEEIQKLAEQFGLEILHKEEWLSGNRPSEDTWSVCFIGKKL